MRHALFGSFIRSLEIESVTFYCRGLTCAEYVDVIDSGVLERSSATGFYERIAQVGLVDWEDMISQDEDEDEEMEEIIFSEDNKLILADQKPEVMLEIGKFIYHSLTIISEEENQQYRGHIRFLMYLADDEKEKERESYSCDNCLKSGRQVNRKCGLSETNRNEILKRNNMSVEVTDIHEEFIKTNLDKYKNKSKQKKVQSPVSKDEARLKLLGFTFPECPVSWIPQNVKEWSDRVYTAKNHGVPLFEGGIMEQPNKSYLISKIVNNEISSIESEKMKKDMKKNSKGRK